MELFIVTWPQVQRPAPSRAKDFQILKSGNHLEGETGDQIDITCDILDRLDQILQYWSTLILPLCLMN